jgi:hypothetical protein
MSDNQSNFPMTIVYNDTGECVVVNCPQEIQSNRSHHIVEKVFKYPKENNYMALWVDFYKTGIQLWQLDVDERPEAYDEEGEPYSDTINIHEYANWFATAAMDDYNRKAKG